MTGSIARSLNPAKSWTGGHLGRQGRRPTPGGVVGPARNQSQRRRSQDSRLAVGVRLRGPSRPLHVGRQRSAIRGDDRREKDSLDG